MACCQVEAAIATMIRWVAEEDAGGRARTEIFGRRGAEVGVAETPKDTKLIISWRCTKEKVMRHQGAGGAAWASVQQVRRRVQGLCPVRWRSCTMINNVRKQSLIVRSTRSALPFCWDVYGQESRREIPWVEKKARKTCESYSRLLSVCSTTIGRQNWVCT